jgi:hypothetical protein
MQVKVCAVMERPHHALASKVLKKSEEALDTVLYKDGLQFGKFVQEDITHHLDRPVTIEKGERRQLFN